MIVKTRDGRKIFGAPDWMQEEIPVIYDCYVTKRGRYAGEIHCEGMGGARQFRTMELPCRSVKTNEIVVINRDDVAVVLDKRPLVCAGVTVRATFEMVDIEERFPRFAEVAGRLKCKHKICVYDVTGTLLLFGDDVEEVLDKMVYMIHRGRIKGSVIAL